MGRYILRRLVSGILILFVFVSIVFFVTQLLLPGDYVSQFFGLSPQAKAELRQELGLDKPIGERYVTWLFNVLRGDLGSSYTAFGGAGGEVSKIVGESLMPTALVFGLGVTLAFGLGQWLGKVVGWRRRHWTSGPITFGAIALYTSFPPWLVFLLVYVLVDQLNLLPGVSQSSLFGPPPVHDADVIWPMIAGALIVTTVWVSINRALHFFWRRRLPGVLFVLLLVGGWVVSWQPLGVADLAPGVLRRAALPIIAFTLLTFGEIMLIMRTTMIDARHEDYVQAARAKGLSDRHVRDRHVARNALLPVVSRLVISLPYLMAGVVMIEQVTGWSGMGSTLFYALGQQNAPLMTGMALAIGVFSLVSRLALDVLYVTLDPRVRSGAQLSRRYL